MKTSLFATLLFAASFSLCQAQINYWNPVVSGTTKVLLSISFGSSTTGYIAGKDTTLLKTTDGRPKLATVKFKWHHRHREYA